MLVNYLWTGWEGGRLDGGWEGEATGAMTIQAATGVPSPSVIEPRTHTLLSYTDLLGSLPSISRQSHF